MKTDNAGSANEVMTACKCTGNAIIFRDSKGLPGTDDPRIGKNPRFPNIPKQSSYPKKSFQLIKILEDENINTHRMLF